MKRNKTTITCRPELITNAHHPYPDSECRLTRVIFQSGYRRVKSVARNQRSGFTGSPAGRTVALCGYANTVRYGAIASAIPCWTMQQRLAAHSRVDRWWRISSSSGTRPTA